MKTELLRGLRRTQDEAQLTRTIASVAAADRTFAAAFVRLLLSVAKSDERHAANVSQMGNVPDNVRCLTEHVVRGDETLDGGRVDLRFDDGDNFTLLVENKLSSDFGPQQLKRYQHALRLLPEGRTHAGLIAVTRDVPRFGELDAGEDGWLGAVRWARLYDEGLANLPFDDDDLALQWQLFVELLHEDGDLGMTDTNPELVLAWTQFDPAREQLCLLLDSVRGRALETLRGLLKSKPPRPTGAREDVAAQHHLGKREAQPLSTSSRHAVWTGLRVPASLNHPTIRLNFWVAEPGAITFGVEVWPWRANERLLGRERRLVSAARRLADAGFNEQLDPSGEYTFWREHPHDEFLYHEDAARRLAEIVDADLDVIVSSGVLGGEFEQALSRGKKAPPKAPS
jgi:hypothetical protein